MLKTFLKSYIFLTALGAVAWATPIVSLQGPTQVSPGGMFDVSVEISGATANVAGFQFDLTFDSTLLQVTNQTEGGYLSTGLPPNSTFFGSGAVTVGAPGNDNLQAVSDATAGPASTAASGTLAVITFQAIGNPKAGPAAIALANVFLVDPSTNLIIPNIGTPISVGINPGLGSGAPTPEPSTLLPCLTVLGLWVFITVRRRWQV